MSADATVVSSMAPELFRDFFPTKVQKVGLVAKLENVVAKLSHKSAAGVSLAGSLSALYWGFALTESDANALVKPLKEA